MELEANFLSSVRSIIILRSLHATVLRRIYSPSKFSIFTHTQSYRWRPLSSFLVDMHDHEQRGFQHTKHTLNIHFDRVPTSTFRLFAVYVLFLVQSPAPASIHPPSAISSTSWIEGLAYISGSAKIASLFRSLHSNRRDYLVNRVLVRFYVRIQVLFLVLASSRVVTIVRCLWWYYLPLAQVIFDSLTL